MIHPTDSTLILKQWTEIQDKSLKNTLSVMDVFHKHAEKLAGRFWEQTVWASEKISDTLMGWENVYKTGYENLERVMGPACMMTPKTAPPASPSPESEPSHT